ncbi:MAG: dUTPase [Bacillota bacterium]
MMDKLESIFAMQKALDDDITSRRHLDGFSPQEWIQKDVLAIVAELGELLDEVNFKWWKNPKEIDTAAVQEELVDVLHFFISMCIRAGMSAEDLYRIYSDKNKENVDRQHGRSEKPGYAVADNDAE